MESPEGETGRYTDKKISQHCRRHDYAVIHKIFPHFALEKYVFKIFNRQ
jgi:hypothetical protein